jgi:hypothetical protein
LIPKFASEAPQGFANFGIGTLKRFPIELNRWDSHGSKDERIFEH